MCKGCGVPDFAATGSKKTADAAGETMTGFGLTMPCEEGSFLLGLGEAVCATSEYCAAVMSYDTTHMKWSTPSSQLHYFFHPTILANDQPQLFASLVSEYALPQYVGI